MARVGTMLLLACGLAAYAPGLSGAELSAPTDAADARASARRQQDTRTLEACLERRGERADVCISLVAGRCLKNARDTQAEADCYRREAAAWSAIVDNYRAQVIGELRSQPDKVAAFDASQRIWLEHRAKSCAFIDVFIDGSLGVPAASACEARESARRAIDLRRLVQYAGLAQ